MVNPSGILRRDFLQTVAGLGAGIVCVTNVHLAEPAEKPNSPPPAAFRLRYLLASCLYGYTELKEILPEVRKTGAEAIDLWPKVHGNQREQLDALGEERFRAMLQAHQAALGCLTRYDLGPFGLKDEMRLAKRLGCRLIVTGASGPKGLTGEPLRQAIQEFIEKLKPHLAEAAKCGVTIAIENHQNSLIESPDSLRWLVELCPDEHLAIALAPYHLPQDPKLLAELIRAVGRRMAVFYAWQHGKGSTKPMPPEEELLQLPGRGPLDFRPLLAALRDVNYRGYTSIFMHPFPRGRAIRPSTAAVTAEINQARQYLETCLANLSGPLGKEGSMEKVLIIVGDATETVDTLYPYYRLIEAGFQPVVAAPEKRRYQMVLHEVKPGWTITKEWEGYTIEADIAFRDVRPEEYLGIFFSGGRAPEYIRYDPDLVRITKHFFETNKPIGCVCHGVEIPAYARCVRGRRMATVPKCRFDLEVCGGIFVDAPCVIDGNLVSGRTYHDHGHYIGAWIKLLEQARSAKKG